MKKSNQILLITLGVIIIIIISSLIYLRSVFNTEVLRGEGNTVEVERYTDDFEKVRISGNYTVYFTQEGNTQLILEADENLHEYIITEVRNRELIIRSSQPIRSSRDIIIHLSSPVLTNVEASAAASFVAENSLKTEGFYAMANAASTITLDGTFASINAVQNAGSKINLSGTTNNFYSESNAGGTIDASKLKAQTATAKANAGGRITLNADEIDASANAGGTILYIGNPIFKGMSTSAGGSIRQTSR